MADLHFTINDSSGGSPQTIQPHEVPMQGEMDHLPNNSGGSPTGATTERSTLEYMQDKLNSSAHPTVVIFHILFKAIALFLYIFGGWFLPSSSSASGGGSFITLTVVIILLLAADFWVVKNVTGRLLVGLRWWNKVEEETTTWIFESHEQSDKPKAINAFDKSIFWTVLYAAPFAWVTMLFFAVIKFEINWLMVCIMALALSCSNVYGYYKCSSDQKARFQQLGAQVTQRGAMAVMSSSMLSALTGQNTAAAGATAGTPA